MRGPEPRQTIQIRSSEEIDGNSAEMCLVKSTDVTGVGNCVMLTCCLPSSDNNQDKELPVERIEFTRLKL